MVSAMCKTSGIEARSVSRFGLLARQALVAAGLLLAAGADPASANWTTLNSGTNQDLIAVHFPTDASTGYVVGMRGTILKTTNGGSTWSKQSAGTTIGLTGVHFPVDAVTGYAVGGSGIILKTTNGGAKWTRLTSGTTQNLRSVYFLDANTGYVGGDSQTLLKTTNGGLTWQTQLVAEGSIFAIQFPGNGQTGYAAAIYGSIGYVYKTEDGGANWVRVFNIDDAFLYSLHFPAGDQVGYVVNSDSTYQYGIWKTTDGGATWNPVNQGITEAPVAAYFSTDALTGIAVGNRGSIFKTTDGGMLWQEGRIDTDKTLRDVQFVSASTGFLVGSGGFIAKTTDGGAPNSLAMHVHPTGVGWISEFTSKVGCTASWDCVNDQSGNAGTGLPVAADIVTYIADGSSHREYFALPDGLIGPGQRVTAISVNLVIVPDSGPYVALGYRRVGIDSTAVETVPFWVGYAYPLPASWMWTGLDWRSADIDALQIGLWPASGSVVEAAQMYLKLFYGPIP